jgi:hypothetical protein
VTDPALDAVRQFCIALDRDFFNSKLRADTIKLRWLPRSSGADGSCNPYTREISIGRHMIAMPQRRPLVTVLLHELAHCATRAETADHGPRWQAVMRRCGLDPMTGAIGSVIDDWIAVHLARGPMR